MQASSTGLTARCHCGNLTVHVQLSHPLDKLVPRACDCSFCRMHGAAYVSDPNGKLRMRVLNGLDLVRYRQGAELADMLICRRCGVLIGASYEADGRTFATLNGRILVDVQLPDAQAVSPQRLSAEAKSERWQKLWFADVSIETD